MTAETTSTEPSSGVVECRNCLGYWTWNEASRDQWGTVYAFTWDSEAVAIAYLRQHRCGGQGMTIRKDSK